MQTQSLQDLNLYFPRPVGVVLTVLWVGWMAWKASVLIAALVHHLVPRESARRAADVATADVAGD